MSASSVKKENLINATETFSEMLERVTQMYASRAKSLRSEHEDVIKTGTNSLAAMVEEDEVKELEEFVDVLEKLGEKFQGERVKLLTELENDIMYPPAGHQQ